MFEKTLQDVVTGIRASKRDTGLYISQCIAEIKTEINSSDMYVKSNALQKLTFLQMMGYSMNWASFATIEVMSSPRFAHKRIGYLAASQGFTQDTEVILLTTNLLKKELRGAVGGGMHGVYEAGLAINCISNIVTEDLARDLLPELTNLTTHPQPYLRKKAVLCLFKAFVKYPQGLRLTFAKIQQCLGDTNPSVVSCAVNVITELSDKNPKNYLHLAPAFFDLLTQSSNNWMLIKVVKLLGSLVPEEPRLARKLLEPLANIVKSTQAKSLLYEAVHTITLCLPYCRKSDGSMPAIVPDIVTLCSQTLRGFVEETDQNLKYLGLVGFASIMRSHPKVLSAPDYRPLILACLSDQDETIRTRALDLLIGMASPKNLVELVSQLLTHVELAKGGYRNSLVAKIIELCSYEKYSLLQDFGWYLNVLFQLGHMRGIETHGVLLRSQITDIALRVLPVRPYAVRRSIQVLLERDGAASDDPSGDNGRGKHIMTEILPSVGWIVGEYSDLIRQALSTAGDEDDSWDGYSYNEQSKGCYHALIQVLTDPYNIQNLPSRTQQVYVQAATKVFAAVTADSDGSLVEVEACLQVLLDNLQIYTQSTNVEVAERSFEIIALLSSLDLTDKRSSLGSIQGDRLMSTTSGDLLGMNGGSIEKTFGSGSVSGGIRDVSLTLNWILKPSAMKPVGGKAQRKKHNALKNVTLDLQLDVDLQAFDDFIQDEETFRSKSKLSIEAVCFTQQRLYQVEEHLMTSFSSGPTADLPSVSNASVALRTEPSTSFQKPFSGSIATAPRQRLGDPFYLDTGPAQTEESRRDDNRFGTIQLFDSDEEPANDKTKKRKKEKKMKLAKGGNEDSAGASSLVSFGEIGSPSGMPPITLYDSDDEDEKPGTAVVSRSRPSKEFEGLAKVDLTTPLREDEVMPEHRHRVVPERPVAEPTTTERKKKSKSRKDKKASKDPPSSSVGDLLDLVGLSQPSSSGPSMNGPTSNPISNAFDDLLGLAAPLPAPQLPATDNFLSSATSIDPTATSQLPPPSSIVKKKSSKRPWMKATLKVSSSSSSREVDWSNVTLVYRVYPASNDDGLKTVLIAFRLDNNGSSAISNAVVELRQYGSISLGHVGRGSSVESDKVGPFTYSQLDVSEEIRGTLSATSSTVPIKLSLPASFQLLPDDGVTLEQIAQELSSTDWASTTVKIEVVSGLTSAAIKSVFVNFLQAHEIADGSGPTTGTFAARSPSGARVRVMAKIRDRTVKIDLRSSNPSLCKALASDVKRLVL